MKDFVTLSVFVLWATGSPVLGAERQIKAEVSFVSGSADYVVNGQAHRLTVGTVLPEGSIIQTGRGASVDIHLGYNVLLLRLTQNTVLGIDKLEIEQQPGVNAIDVQLTLNQGVIVGQVTELSGAARFEVKVANGVASVRDGRFRIHAEGYVVQLQGLALFAHVPRTGEPVLHQIQAPPPQYFTPKEGIKRAPQRLVEEVINQLKPRMRGR